MTSNSPRLGQTSGASPHVSHAAVEKGQTSALLQLLQLEADIRHIETTRELVFHLANESRAVLGFRQAFVFRHVRKWRLAAVSSVSTFDKHAPLNREMQQFVSSLGSEFSGSTAHRIDLTRVRRDQNASRLRVSPRPLDSHPQSTRLSVCWTTSIARGALANERPATDREGGQNLWPCLGGTRRSQTRPLPLHSKKRPYDISFFRCACRWAYKGPPSRLGSGRSDWTRQDSSGRTYERCDPRCACSAEQLGRGGRGSG